MAGVDFPVPIEKIHPIELANRINVSVFRYDVAVGIIPVGCKDLRGEIRHRD